MDETLEKRHDSEKDFHDKKYHDNKESHYKSSGSNILLAKMWEMMGDLNGKMVVDYGCGTGRYMTLFKKRENRLDALF